MQVNTKRRILLRFDEVVTDVNVLHGGSAVEIIVESHDCAVEFRKFYKEQIVNEIDEFFPIVEASKLSLDDDFLDYIPVTDRQKKLKSQIENVIKEGITDFRVQKYDPTFDDDFNICYGKLNKPAIDKSARWWKKRALEFWPEKQSRLGNINERVAFLAVLIKQFVNEKNMNKEVAWNYICDNSCFLGNYWDSYDSKHRLEKTGMRQVFKWLDLGNTYKIISDNEEKFFYTVGGDYSSDGKEHPLSDMYLISDCNHSLYSGTGWIVLPE